MVGLDLQAQIILDILEEHFSNEESDSYEDLRCNQLRFKDNRIVSYII